ERAEPRLAEGPALDVDHLALEKERRSVAERVLAEQVQAHAIQAGQERLVFYGVEAVTARRDRNGREEGPGAGVRGVEAPVRREAPCRRVSGGIGEGAARRQEQQAQVLHQDL